MPIKSFIFGLVILLASAVAHAQVGNCPAGTIPNGDQRSPGACVPDPSYTQQPQRPLTPPPIWVDHWGAIALAEPGSPPAFGASANMPSKEKAKAAAMAECQATPHATCKIHTTYRNQCIALVKGNSTSMPMGGSTREDAESHSREKCKSLGNTECTLYYAACSYPVRIQ